MAARDSAFALRSRPSSTRYRSVVFMMCPGLERPARWRRPRGWGRGTGRGRLLGRGDAHDLADRVVEVLHALRGAARGPFGHDGFGQDLLEQRLVGFGRLDQRHLALDRLLAAVGAGVAVVA